MYWLQNTTSMITYFGLEQYSSMIT